MTKEKAIKEIIDLMYSHAQAIDEFNKAMKSGHIQDIDYNRLGDKKKIIHERIKTIINSLYFY